MHYYCNFEYAQCIYIYMYIRVAVLIKKLTLFADVLLFDSQKSELHSGAALESLKCCFPLPATVLFILTPMHLMRAKNPRILARNLRPVSPRATDRLFFYSFSFFARRSDLFELAKIRFFYCPLMYLLVPGNSFVISFYEVIWGEYTSYRRPKRWNKCTYLKHKCNLIEHKNIF